MEVKTHRNAMDTEATKKTQKYHSTTRNISLVILTIILVSGTFLRFYQLEKVYSDFDDTIMVANHKTVFFDKAIKKSAGSFEFNITIKKKLINNLLDSPLYALFWGLRSTYPPGQYLFYPLILDESDSYYEKIFKGRLLPAIFSSLSLFLLVFLLFKINGDKLEHTFLIPTAIMACSFNSVLYAHHMSPYALTATTFLLALILLCDALKEPAYTIRFFVYLAILNIFNYLILLTIPLFCTALIIRHKWYHWKTATLALYKGVLAYAVIFLPIALLFLKTGSGMRGASSPDFEDSITQYLFYFPIQFTKTASSIFASFTVNQTVNMILVFFLISGGAIVLYKNFRSLGNEKYIYLSVFLFFVEWVTLHSLDKLIMDQTRHVLMWLPGICLIIFLLIKSFKVNHFASIIISLVIMFSGLQNNLNIMGSKISRFDFKMIEENELNTVLTYGATLAPVLYFHNKKQVYNTEMWSFVNNYKKLNLPDKMLLTSATEPINKYLNGGYGWNKFMDFYDHYDIKPIKEEPSDIRFLFNNYRYSFPVKLGDAPKPVHTMDANGFFLYEMTRKVDSNP